MQETVKDCGTNHLNKIVAIGPNVVVVVVVVVVVAA